VSFARTIQAAQYAVQVIMAHRVTLVLFNHVSGMHRKGRISHSLMGSQAVRLGIL
jgi:hypothetical protein